jgi:hypothetical protein
MKMDNPFTEFVDSVLHIIESEIYETAVFKEMTIYKATAQRFFQTENYRHYILSGLAVIHYTTISKRQEQKINVVFSDQKTSNLFKVTMDKKGTTLSVFGDVNPYGEIRYRSTN